MSNKKLEEKIGTLLLKHNMKLSIAESCSGGLISHRITSIPGCSHYFDRGIVVYSNNAKMELLKVKEETLMEYGAVSSKTSKEMAEGVRLSSNTDIGIAVTGIAGPGGGTKEKPLGLVYISLSSKDTLICKKNNFDGARFDVKNKTAQKALEMLLEYLENR